MASMPTPTGYAQQGQLPMPQQQTIIVTAPSFGTHKAQVTCASCGNNVQTQTEKHPSVVAWISSVALCCLGCWLGCCLIPLCVDSCMDVDHTCPSCKSKLGTHKAF